MLIRFAQTLAYENFMTERILTPADADKTEFRNLYESAFPLAEQIPWQSILRLIDLVPLKFTAYYVEDRFIGFTIVNTKTVTWLWYFAVLAGQCGKGYGQQILSHLIERHSGSVIVIEIESPYQHCANEEQRRHRHNFYLRNGFVDTDEAYSYKGDDYIVMKHGTAPFTRKDYDTIMSQVEKQEWSKEIPWF